MVDADKIVERIFSDISDRRGLRQALDETDDDIKDEMKDEWREIVAQEAKPLLDWCRKHYEREEGPGRTDRPEYEELRQLLGR